MHAFHRVESSAAYQARVDAELRYLHSNAARGLVRGPWGAWPLDPANLPCLRSLEKGSSDRRYLIPMVRPGVQFRVVPSDRQEFYVGPECCHRQSLISCAATLGRSGPTATSSASQAPPVWAAAHCSVCDKRCWTTNILGPEPYPTDRSRPCKCQPSMHIAPPRSCDAPATPAFIDARDQHSAISWKA